MNIKHVSIVIFVRITTVGCFTNAWEPYSELSAHVWFVWHKIPSRHYEMSICLVNLISSFKLHVGNASQYKQTKRKWLSTGSESPK